MNKAAIAAGSLVVLLLGAPWVAGALTQRQFVADVARIEDNGRLRVEVVDYDRGWMTTRARVELGLSNSQLGAIESGVEELDEMPVDVETLYETIPLLVSMRHGPVVLGDAPGVGLMQTTIEIDPAAEDWAELRQELGVERLFELNARTDFTGRSNYVAEVPALTLAREDLNLSYSGLRVTGFYDGPNRQLTSQSEPSSLSLITPGIDFELEELVFSNDSTRINSHFWLGWTEGSFARVALRGPGPDAGGGELEDVEFRFDIGLDEAGGEHLNLAADYAAGGLTSARALDVSDIAVSIAMRSLELEALTEYVQLSQAAGRPGGPTAPLQLELEDIVYRLLQGSPVIDVSRLAFAFNGEPVDASLSLSVDGANLPARPAFTVMNPLLFTELVSAEAALALSEPLAIWAATRGMLYRLRQTMTAEGEPMPEEDLQTMAEMQAGVALAGLVSQGLLETTDDGYAARASFARGELTINGTQVPLGF